MLSAARRRLAGRLGAALHRARHAAASSPPPPVHLPEPLASALADATAGFRPRQLRAAAAGLLTDLRARSRSREAGGAGASIATAREADDDDDARGLRDLLADDDDDDDDDAANLPWLDVRRQAAAHAATAAAAAAAAAVRLPPPSYTTPAAAAAYAAVRAPATYAATLHALTAVAAAAPGFRPATVLDFGAGSAAATAAAVAVYGASLTAVTAVERCDTMARVGAAVVAAWRERSAGNGAAAAARVPAVRWARRPPHPGVGATHDLVLAAYSVGEAASPAAERALLATLWRRVAPRGVLVVVEPATPAGAAAVAAARDVALASAFPAHTVAPCLHDAPCPLGGARGACRLAQRLVRPALARGVAPGPGRGPPPHQDERFAYVAVRKAAREEEAEGGAATRSRLVAPPRRRARHVLLTACGADGELTTVTVTKGRAPGGTYRAARKAAWGGVWPPLAGGGGGSDDEEEEEESDDGDDGSPSSSSSESSSSSSDSE